MTTKQIASADFSALAHILCEKYYCNFKMKFLVVLFVNNILAMILATTNETAPWIRLKGMFSADAGNPYKIPSNKKYPTTIRNSEARELIANLIAYLLKSLSTLKIKKQEMDISAFITRVAGAYIAYPSSRSASAEPTPAQMHPRGPKIQADKRTKASPKFTYPKPAGIGIAMK